MMTKNLELNGLVVPEFSDDLKMKLLGDIPSTGSANNPIDITFGKSFTSLFVDFPKILMKSGEIDSIIVFGVKKSVFFLQKYIDDGDKNDYIE